MDWEARIANYTQETGFPRSLFLAGDGRVVGTWIMGNNYRVASGYYGGYPHGYLSRIKALFPDKTSVLHLFSGKVDTSIIPGDTVDIRSELVPTYLTNAEDLDLVPLGKYDLILADPPYSSEDAEHYGTPMVGRNKVIQQLTRCAIGTHIVWLDQVLPMWSKSILALDGCIGVVRSTNHRFRMITIFRRL